MSYNVPNLQAPLDQYGSPDNGTGLWSMILGIISLLFGGFLLGIPAIILGSKGRKKAAAGRATNGGQALAGMITGSISTVLTVIFVLVQLAK
jgi:hypothetical protein